MTSLFGGRRKKFIVSVPDPELPVTYLGNVLTPLAKHDVEKPLALIWRTFCARQRPDLPMTLRVTSAGLKAQTKQQGLTEYWAHRITWCGAPEAYPKVFCWIYKHEGKKMKPELRCHAALCRKADQPTRLVAALQDKVTAALLDYKREKVARQNVRLAATLLGAAPAVPRRRLMLNTGFQNFRPPVTRSRSAPRLHSIDEEEGDQGDSANDDDAESSNGSSATCSFPKMVRPTEKNQTGSYRHELPRHLRPSWAKRSIPPNLESSKTTLNAETTIDMLKRVWSQHGLATTRDTSATTLETRAAKLILPVAPPSDSMTSSYHPHLVTACYIAQLSLDSQFVDGDDDDVIILPDDDNSSQSLTPNSTGAPLSDALMTSSLAPKRPAANQDNLDAVSDESGYHEEKLSNQDDLPVLNEAGLNDGKRTPTVEDDDVVVSL